MAKRSVWMKFPTSTGHALMRCLNGSTRVRVDVPRHGMAELELWQGLYRAETKMGWEVPEHASDAYLKRAAMDVVKGYVRLLKEAGL